MPNNPDYPNEGLTDAYIERINRLERALIRRGAHAITMNAIGEPDVHQLQQEMKRLKFEFRGCVEHGYTFESQFRKSSLTHQAVVGNSETSCEHSSIIEAAIAALEAVPPQREHRDSANSLGGSPQQIDRGRRWRPFAFPTRLAQPRTRSDHGRFIP